MTAASVMPFVVAHLVTTGVGPFYDGASHVLVSPDELLPILALGLLAGMRGPRPGRWIVMLLPLAWVLGGVAGIVHPVAAPRLPLTMALAGIPAILIATDRRLPFEVISGLAVSLGLWIGFLSGAAMATGNALSVVLGGALCVLVITTLSAGLAASLVTGWPRIVVRVAGSWMAAVALLALGWTFRMHG